MADSLLTMTGSGFYCPAGDFYIDPWRPVANAIITHAHADHARVGMEKYLTVADGEAILRARVGPGADIQTVGYRESIKLRDAAVSFHPAGHILGSAQIRIESKGLIWVVSGDYKTVPDSTCAPFEPVRCHGFITEATFALPIYRWKPQEETFAEINDWWRGNRGDGRTSVLYGYTLGKAQRLLAGVDSTIGPILTHGAVERMTQLYRDAGYQLPPTRNAMDAAKKDLPGALIVAPPSANGNSWVRRFGDFSSGLASGWMLVRGARRRRAVDRGFVLSDHADWPGLLGAISATSAETVWVTHGQSSALVQTLSEQGLEALAVNTEFEGEPEEPTDGEG